MAYSSQVISEKLLSSIKITNELKDTKYVI